MGDQLQLSWTVSGECLEVPLSTLSVVSDV